MFLLCILDGFGLRGVKEGNAILAARNPNIMSLFKSWPNRAIEGSGLAVGLPRGQMGNSEVGHLNFGAGRVVYQEITRIDEAIRDGSFFRNPALAGSMKKAVDSGAAIHLFGLVSDGCVHSSLEHLEALIRMAAEHKAEKLFLHAFLDGRDTPPNSGAGYVEQVQRMFGKYRIGRIATLMGRYWGMDRDKRWERSERAYAAIVYGRGKHGEDPVEAVRQSYTAGVTDEFVEPVVLNDGDRDGKLRSKDLALFFNFRADRVRQLNHLFEGIQPLTTIADENGPGGLKVNLVNMTHYDDRLKTPQVAFPPMPMNNLLGGILAERGLKQLRIAETEKYPHVTYFFNGGQETPFPGEDRIMIPSPKVATYDLQPEMSAPEVTEKVVAAIDSKRYDLIVLNFANCDMVGHTCIFAAAVKAVETVDGCVGRVFEALLRNGGTGILTADHGNVDMMVDPQTGEPFTAHTTSPVPCVLVNGPKMRDLRAGGKLADVAPTILDILKIEKPVEMTGVSLLV
ncbi:MAG: 2,3-bisphosphoglycerate-independent phosphoglycerate mutase [candidate division Zixibacteria bacterium]|nr:2,3-bisphosphoglycerate-independent phosphoglycerate mutase [candidate division Zixibacteria bacterium]